MPALPTLFYEADRGARTASNLGLPADLLEKTRGRIRIVALLVLFASGLDVLIWVGQRIAIAFGDAPPLEATSRIPFSGSLMMFLVCAAMVVLTRTPRISNAQLLWAGLGLEVLLCATISLSNPIAVYQDQGSLPQLTWVTPLIILFPLIVPLAPHATLMTAVLAVVLMGRRRAGARRGRRRRRGVVMPVVIMALLGQHGRRQHHARGEETCDEKGAHRMPS